MSGKNPSRAALILMLVSLAALLMIVPAASAQEAHSVELIGVIESLSVNTLTVNQQPVSISEAEINTALTVGALVEIEGTFGTNGLISAREVNPVRPGLVAGEAELTGRLTSLRDTTVLIGGQMIDVSGAEIFGSLIVGERVRIHASVVGPNTWRAREVEVLTGDDSAADFPDDEFEITGTLESIDGAMVTVAGQQISLSGAEINDPLVIGTRVKVHVRVAAGVFTAREIELADPDADDDNSNANVNGNVNENDNSDDNSNTNSNDNVQGAVVSLEQAISEVRRVYPNAQIRSVELTTRFGGTPVWEIEIAGGIELIINAQTGILLLIDQPGTGDNQNSNSNSNDNSDDSFENDNSDDNGNDNEDDDSNENGGNSNDNEDDDRGSNDNEDDDHEDDDNDND